MLNHYVSEIERCTKKYDEKQIKALEINTMINLASKLKSYENESVEKSMNEVLSLLISLDIYNKKEQKQFNKSFSQTKEIVKKILGLYERGTIGTMFAVYGMIFGIVTGSIVGSGIGSGIGAGLGLAFGSGIGKKREASLEKMDRLY